MVLKCQERLWRQESQSDKMIHVPFSQPVSSDFSSSTQFSLKKLRLSIVRIVYSEVESWENSHDLA